jgi:hypothetical protein
MMDKIKDALLNKWTVGGSLLIIGGVTLVGGNWMGDVLNRVLFAVPMVGDVTILRIMGLITTLLGIAVLTGFDPLDLQDEV